jgi:hypothetical protein
MINLSEGIFRDKSSEQFLLLTKCKQLARTLKARRPLFQSIASAFSFRDHVPSRQTCDQLLDLYLRTFETVFRVLHIPTFLKEYSQYWDKPQEASEGFVVKLLLVIAIGACFYHDPHSSENSLYYRSSLWIQAAQLWMTAPFDKHRLDLNGVQVHCLLLLAYQVNPIGGEDVWIHAGALVRNAMTIGLHRDPSLIPVTSVFVAEIRRRLWATVLEIAIQTSLDSGMPPMISVDDFDCDAPANIDDAQISEDTIEPVTPMPPEVYTQTSAQCALMRSLPIRLKIAHSLNGLRDDLSYEETLRIGAELTNYCRSNSTLFNSFISSPSAKQNKPRVFQVKFLDLLIRRFLICLHSPFANKASQNPAYYFSRKVCLDNSLLLFSYLSSFERSTSHGQENDFMPLTIYGRGLFKCTLKVTSGRIILELILELQQDTAPFQTSLPRNDLYQVSQDMIEIARRRIVAGDFNVRAHVLYASAQSQIDAMREGSSVEEAILDTAKRSLKTCYAILKDQLEQGCPLSAVEFANERARLDDLETSGGTGFNGFLVSILTDWFLPGQYSDQDIGFYEH